MRSDRMYIVKGRVTDPEAHKEPCRVGDIEWRLMDDPILPSYSYDYLTLEGLIYDNAGLLMVFYDDAMVNQEQDRLDTAVKLREIHG
jgi:hypothetical protein